jgi:hypothetical protein
MFVVPTDSRASFVQHWFSSTAQRRLTLPAARTQPDHDRVGDTIETVILRRGLGMLSASQRDFQI